MAFVRNCNFETRFCQESCYSPQFQYAAPQKQPLSGSGYSPQHQPISKYSYQQQQQQQQQKTSQTWNDQPVYAPAKTYCQNWEDYPMPKASNVPFRLLAKIDIGAYEAENMGGKLTIDAIAAAAKPSPQCFDTYDVACVSWADQMDFEDAELEQALKEEEKGTSHCGEEWSEETGGEVENSTPYCSASASYWDAPVLLKQPQRQRIPRAVVARFIQAFLTFQKDFMAHITPVNLALNQQFDRDALGKLQHRGDLLRFIKCERLQSMFEVEHIESVVEGRRVRDAIITLKPEHRYPQQWSSRMLGRVLAYFHYLPTSETTVDHIMEAVLGPMWVDADSKMFAQFLQRYPHKFQIMEMHTPYGSVGSLIEVKLNASASKFQQQQQKVGSRRSFTAAAVEPLHMQSHIRAAQKNQNNVNGHNTKNAVQK